jgi:glycosyltransferase involved in cell wall biosynthesis
VKIAIVAPACFASTGGPAKSIAAFRRALDARVIAWMDAAAGDREALVVPADAAVRSTTIPGLRTLLYPVAADAQAAAGIVRDSDLVSCHLFWRWYCPWTCAEAGKARVPYWLVPHGGLDPYVFRTNGWAKRMFAATVARPFLASASGVVCSTTREYEKACRHLPSAIPYVLHWPLEPDDFRSREEARRQAARERLGIPEEAFCLVYLGRLHPMKRPLETIEAVARCNRRDVHLLIVGNEYGVSTSDCQAAADRFGIRDRVHVAGAAYGSAKHDFLDAADCFISLSHRENFNFAAAEAIASGLPVILSPGNDLGPELAGVDCGWMLPRVELAAEAISTAAATPRPVMREMGDRGRDWAEQNLQFETFRTRLRACAARCIEESRN